MLDNKNYTILIVDDEPSNIDILVDALKNDYSIQVAPDGEIALKIIERKHPDLILLDIMMPGISGYEVCRRLKDDELTRNIPIIFATAMDDDYDQFRGLELGAVDFFTKPFDTIEIKKRIKELQEKA
jgi:putative two-component system response regulator